MSAACLPLVNLVHAYGVVKADNRFYALCGIVQIIEAETGLGLANLSGLELHEKMPSELTMGSQR